MFSSDNTHNEKVKKMLNIRNEYIQRIENNVERLTKQLRFLNNLDEQIGGTTKGSKSQRGSSPKKVTPPPAKVTSSPAKVTPSPAKVTPSPAKATSSPAKVATPPAKVATPPAKATSSPAKVATPLVKTPVSKDVTDYIAKVLSDARYKNVVSMSEEATKKLVKLKEEMDKTLKAANEKNSKLVETLNKQVENINNVNIQKFNIEQSDKKKQALVDATDTFVKSGDTQKYKDAVKIFTSSN